MFMQERNLLKACLSGCTKYNCISASACFATRIQSQNVKTDTNTAAYLEVKKMTEQACLEVKLWFCILMCNTTQIFVKKL